MKGRSASTRLVAGRILALRRLDRTLQLRLLLRGGSLGRLCRLRLLRPRGAACSRPRPRLWDMSRTGRGRVLHMSACSRPRRACCSAAARRCLSSRSASPTTPIPSASSIRLRSTAASVTWESRSSCARAMDMSWTCRGRVMDRSNSRESSSSCSFLLHDSRFCCSVFAASIALRASLSRRPLTADVDVGWPRRSACTSACTGGRGLCHSIIHYTSSGQ